MAYWGSAPWQNDYAADWFGEVFMKTKLDSVIEDSLQQSISNEFSYDQLRAAITLFILLGHVYIYNSDTYEEHLELCIVKNQELLGYWKSGGWNQDAEVKKWLEYEQELLARRRSNIGVRAAMRPRISDNLKAWWSEWLD